MIKRAIKYKEKVVLVNSIVDKKKNEKFNSVLKEGGFRPCFFLEIYSQSENSR